LTNQNTEGFKMDIKKDRNLFKEALNSGCRTAAELALFLRLRAKHV